MRIEIPGDEKMKKHVNYLLAASVFILMLVLLYGSSVMLAAVVSLLGFFLGGSEGFSAGYWFLLDHMNLVSCVVYMVPAVAFILWYWFEVVRRSGPASFARAQIKRVTPAGVLWTFILAYAVQHAVSIIIGFLAILLPETVEAYDAELVESAGMTDYSLAWVFAVVILPPLVEETVFRGLIFHYLKKGGAGFWAANLIQAVLFGIYHGNSEKGRRGILGGQSDPGGPVRDLSRQSGPGDLCVLHRPPARVSGGALQQPDHPGHGTCIV